MVSDQSKLTVENIKYYRVGTIDKDNNNIKSIDSEINKVNNKFHTLIIVKSRSGI